jgi:hypothetical protein
VRVSLVGAEIVRLCWFVVQAGALMVMACGLRFSWWAPPELLNQRSSVSVQLATPLPSVVALHSELPKPSLTDTVAPLRAAELEDRSTVTV